MIVHAKKVLILGSSALKIGEAGEFDYSGSQAIKALKEEGVETILINPNIATIQTSEHLADHIYFLPITPRFVGKVIAKEQPDGILLGFGGQTALNCGLALEKLGVLHRHGVKVLGTPIRAIRDTEDRDLFVKRLNEIGLPVPRSQVATTVEEALRVAQEVGYPVMVRIAFALGGLNSGMCRNEDQLRLLAGRALSHTSQILIEEYLQGWKEIEYEVVRDSADNCITVCNMENVDPLGIHTGESIVVAPSQTLTNGEYHMLREISIRVIRHLGIIGESNIQFALDPESEDYRIIEVNARLSRSSALASKATGYPLAFVAAKLALGYPLHQLPNSITKVTKAFFEPALDYVVVKMPRWDLKKFRRVARQIGSSMKSVGEVMGIGRTFEEALQKAVRMLDIGADGLIGNHGLERGELQRELAEPTEHRIFAVAEALRAGMSVDRIHELSHIDRWFLYKIAHVVELGERLGDLGPEPLPAPLLREAKQRGFCDLQIARLTGRDAEAVSRRRRQLGITPFVRQIDTLAGEYPAQTNYLYLSYNGIEDDADLPIDNAVILLGSGAYRIGCSVEFDWCCVNTGRTLRQLGYRTVMINCNPETVSTDYDEVDQLFFEEINLETVREIHDRVRPVGIIVSVGGQIANDLALKLHNTGIKVLGTSPQSIDKAEDRSKFSSLLDELGVGQPQWKELQTLTDAQAFAQKVGYPVLIRPSYVLSGAAMAVASNDTELSRYLKRAARVTPQHPTVISKFLEDAKEIEFDAVAKEGKIVVYAISEHIENAGVHSGDATLVFPPQRMYLETIRRIRQISKRIANALNIHGPFNIQFIAKDNDVKVIECNLRASRSFPFVSKVINQNFIEIATKIIMGHPIEVIDKRSFELSHVGVKAPVFSFARLEGADPTLGVEMSSTGEVACLGNDFNEAFLKALLSVGYRLPIRTMLLSSGPIAAKADLLDALRLFKKVGIRFYATEGTAAFLKDSGIEAETLHWPLDNRKPSAEDAIRSGQIDLVLNIPKNDQEDELTNDYIIRRAAVDYNVPLITDRQIAMRLAEALSRVGLEDLQIKSWGEYEQEHDL
ncbi:MAG: carbamoyl-phosphate synthase (glutamine-hydrolyzing) large subunit [Planctomycetes bacterium]|nr:carbamoyl-phosphate synthase (glutamine-hydrolyzing) large subunit [Planctomycetota bacterium]